MEDVARSGGRGRNRWTTTIPRRHIRMSDTPMGLKLGQTVPNFELTTFNPVKGDFGKLSLKDQIARKRWSILFFYPADFTFV
jgi:AhpC/TSA family protein